MEHVEEINEVFRKMKEIQELPADEQEAAWEENRAHIDKSMRRVVREQAEMQKETEEARANSRNEERTSEPNPSGLEPEVGASRAQPRCQPDERTSHNEPRTTMEDPHIQREQEQEKY